MRNVHDVGGVLGYGPIDTSDDGKPFHAEYERLTLGLTIASMANGFLHAIDAHRYAKERLTPSALIRGEYWELFLAALEMNLVENGILDLDEIEERSGRPEPGATARVATPDGLHEMLDQILGHGVDLASELPEHRRFSVGDRIRTTVSIDRRHTRLPAYAMGRVGVVVAELPAYPLPDLVAHEPAGTREWTYRVRFEAAELWGTRARDVVLLDLFQSYLIPVATSNSNVQVTP